ncbi:MAG: acetyltransferase [Alphaproteobacteria bacterium]|nr:acetyltransferase [Alphaproteobacteria bacterium]
MKIVIFGISKISEVVYTYIKDTKMFEVAAFCVDKEYLTDKEKFGLPVVDFSDVERSFPPSEYGMLIAIGYHKMNTVRAQKCRDAKEKGYKLVSYVHPRADVASTASIGENCIILNNVSVEPFVKIGDNVCLYCNSTVAHHTVVHDNVWVTSGTVIGGNTDVGENCFLGINSTIGHNIKVGRHNFIGAGAVVTKDTADKSVFIIPDTPKYRLDTDRFMRLFKFD